MAINVARPEGWEKTPIGKFTLLASSKEVDDKVFEDTFLAYEVYSEDEITEICLILKTYRPALYEQYKNLTTTNKVYHGS